MIYRCSRETLTIASLLLSTAFPLICGQTVRGVEGQSVTLPCTYSVKQTNDITTMCWGRGSCPNSKCNDVLIWTDGHSVTHRSSGRYRLNANIAGGEVSLTISQASISDAGTYCCRIEHAGWFNDEKKNIQLYMEKAPKTTPPTTASRTTPKRTTPPPTTRKPTVPPTTRKPTVPPTTRKPTVPPTTREPTVPPVATLSTTAPLPKPDIIPTPTPTPPGSITTTPTGEEPIETSTIHTAERTTTPQTTTAVITIVPPLPTVLHTTPMYTTPMDETTTQEQPLSTDPYVICDFSHEEIQPNEAFNHHHPRSPLPSQPEGHSSENGILDLFSGNITTVVKKEGGFSLHILIIAICVAVVIMVAVSLLILKFRGKARGRYPFGLDPNLELVSHAEASLSETDIEISQTVTLEVDKVEAGKPTL